MTDLLSPEIVGAIGGIVAALSGAVYAVLRRPLVASLRQRLEDSEIERDRVVSTMRNEILRLRTELHELRVILADHGVEIDE